MCPKLDKSETKSRGLNLLRSMALTRLYNFERKLFKDPDLYTSYELIYNKNYNWSTNSQNIMVLILILTLLNVYM